MFKSNDRPESKDLPKAALKPAPYDPPLPPSRPMTSGVRSGFSPQPSPPREYVAPPPVEEPAPAPASASAYAAPSADSGGSKLFIGVNIKLKGVEISDCDVLVIEGQVEATVHSKVMQIDQPGTLNGTALIDVAEIRGEFKGELTARTRLVVHGTGRVSGTIRYGKLIVEEGGELTGDVKRHDGSEAHPQRTLLAGDSRRSAAADHAPNTTNPGHNPGHPGTSRTHPA
jgi:cytoskeletal protein CcmA (bactofilin family)